MIKSKRSLFCAMPWIILCFILLLTGCNNKYCKQKTNKKQYCNDNTNIYDTIKTHEINNINNEKTETYVVTLEGKTLETIKSILLFEYDDPYGTMKDLIDLDCVNISKPVELYVYYDNGATAHLGAAYPIISQSRICTFAFVLDDGSVQLEQVLAQRVYEKHLNTDHSLFLYDVDGLYVITPEKCVRLTTFQPVAGRGGVDPSNWKGFLKLLVEDSSNVEYLRIDFSGYSP